MAKDGMGFFEMSQLTEEELDSLVERMGRGELSDSQVLSQLAERAEVGRLVSTGNLRGYRVA